MHLLNEPGRELGSMKNLRTKIRNKLSATHRECFFPSPEHNFLNIFKSCVDLHNGRGIRLHFQMRCVERARADAVCSLGVCLLNSKLCASLRHCGWGKSRSAPCVRDPVAVQLSRICSRHCKCAQPPPNPAEIAVAR